MLYLYLWINSVLSLKYGIQKSISIAVFASMSKLSIPCAGEGGDTGSCIFMKGGCYAIGMGRVVYRAVNIDDRVDIRLGTRCLKL